MPEARPDVCSLYRWIKFEECVEEGGERWSKPHVATLSLQSLFDLRRALSYSLPLSAPTNAPGTAPSRASGTVRPVILLNADIHAFEQLVGMFSRSRVFFLYIHGSGDIF